MSCSLIRVERELEARLRARAREVLGPEASEAEVEALADEVYYGPEENHGHQETDAERLAYDKEIEETIAMMHRWGV